MAEGEEIRYYGKWNGERLEEVYRYALLGLSEDKIAHAMGISISTFGKWKMEIPDFLQSLRDGQEKALAEVANSLYKLANGYYYDKEVEHVIRGEIVKTTIKEWCPPNAWAAARILSLRHPEKWSETHKIDITNTNININKLDLSGITDEQLRVLEQIQIKQLAKNAGTS